MAIRTENGEVEAYLFERHIDVGGIAKIKSALSGAQGVAFVAQFVGAFNLFARVVADDLGQLQERIAVDYYKAGVRSDWSVNLTGDRLMAPKRHSPDICALVCAKTTVDPFELLATLDDRFGREGGYGAAVVTSSGFDLLVDLGAETIEAAIDRVRDLRKVSGIGRTSTALADLRDNALPPRS